MSEKAVLHVTDLLDWIQSPKEVNWDRGMLGVADVDCATPAPLGAEVSGISSIYYPGHPEFLTDIRQEKVSIGKKRITRGTGRIIVNCHQGTRCFPG
jgi:hypothetical protein